MTRHCSAVVGLVSSAVIAQAAHASSLGTIFSNVEFGNADIPSSIITDIFSVNLPFAVGAQAVVTGTFFMHRLDQPPGFGVDTLVPVDFTAYCVEIGDEILDPGVHDVCNLLGSTTNPGGISGPVFFDAVRTKALQRLWGGFQSMVVDNVSSGAFQLAIWELTFDTDMTLVDPSGTTPFYVAAGQFQPGITDVAEGWLAAVRSSDPLPET